LRKWLHTENPPQRVIVTCRQSDYDSALNLDLPAVVTFDLDPLQIQEFAAHYLEPQSVHTFVEKLGDKPTNLLLLSTQIMLFKKSPQTELPKTPGAVAQCLVKELWEQRGSDSTTLQRMELALADLAFKMNDEEMPVYVPLELAQEYAGDHTLIEAAARAQLLEIRSGKVRFSQRLFLDYFAALGLMRAGLSSRLTPAQFDAQGQRIIGRWDTIVKIAADTLNNPDSIVREVAEIDPYLALECCLQVGISERVYQQVVEQLLLTMRADGDRRVAVARILAQRDAEKAVIILLDSMRDAAWEMRLAAAGVLQDITLPLLPGLTEALHQLEDQTRETTAIALRQIGKDALPTLLRLLSASEWHTRRGAAWALGELKDKAAVPLLIEALYDSDSLVSAEAALALGQIKDPAALTYLLEALDQTNWRVGKAASRALGALGKTAMTPLLEIVTDKNSGTRKQVRAIEALARIHDPAVEPVLLNATRDKNADVRSMAIEALRESKDTAVVKRLVECLHDTARPRWGKQRICDIAASVLDAIGTDDARTAVEKWRARPESGVSGGGKPTKARQARIKEDPEFVKRHPDLAHSLNDPDWMVRRDAVQSLTNIRPSGALPRMLRALNDEDAHVRVTAVQALGYFKGDVRAIAGLLQALSDKDYMVCDAAADVLKRVATAPAPEIRELINSSDVNLRGAALDILGSIRDESAVLDIVDCLGDMRKLYLSDQRICDLAAKALENIGTAAAWDALRQWRKTALVATQPADDKDVLGELIKDLHNPDWNVQQNAAKALREYTKALRGVADTSVGRRLSEMLDDDNWVVRWAAAEALAWLGEKTAVKALLRLMEDSHWMVRCAVIRVLVELGERSAQDGIIEALNDDTSNVREAAAEALGNLGDARAIPHLAKKLDDPELKVKESAGSLRRVLREHDIMLRWAAVEALGRIADPDTVPDLILCLGDTEGPYWEQKRICDIAAAALEHIDTPQARSAVSTWRESVNQ
jgi:HEAT repeat protein